MKRITAVNASRVCKRDIAGLYIELVDDERVRLVTKLSNGAVRWQWFEGKNAVMNAKGYVSTNYRRPTSEVKEYVKWLDETVPDSEDWTKDPYEITLGNVETFKVDMQEPPAVTRVPIPDPPTHVKQIYGIPLATLLRAIADLIEQDEEVLSR